MAVKGGTRWLTPVRKLKEKKVGFSCFNVLRTQNTLKRKINKNKFFLNYDMSVKSFFLSPSLSLRSRGHVAFTREKISICSRYNTQG